MEERLFLPGRKLVVLEWLPLKVVEMKGGCDVIEPH